MRATNCVAHLISAALYVHLTSGCEGQKCGVWEVHDVDPRLRKHTYQIAVGLGGALAEISWEPWYQPRKSGTTEELLAVWAQRENIAVPFVAVGRKGTIRVSDGEGEPWKAPSMQDSISANLRGIAYAVYPDDFGVAVGDFGTVLVGTSRAMRWQEVSTPTTQHLNAAAIDADGHATVVGEGGTVLRTIDHGSSWETVQVPTTENLLSILMLSRPLDASANPPYSHTGYIVGTSGTLLISLDGAGWARVETNIAEDLRQVIYHLDTFSGPGVPLVLGDTSVFTWNADDGQLKLKSNLRRPIYSIGQYLSTITALSSDGKLLEFVEPFVCDLPKD